MIILCAINNIEMEHQNKEIRKVGDTEKIAKPKHSALSELSLFWDLALLWAEVKGETLKTREYKCWSLDINIIFKENRVFVILKRKGLSCSVSQ